MQFKRYVEAARVAINNEFQSYISTFQLENWLESGFISQSYAIELLAESVVFDQIKFNADVSIPLRPGLVWAVMDDADTGMSFHPDLLDDAVELHFTGYIELDANDDGLLVQHCE